MYCPYDNTEHPETTNFNTEHVIPYALGGSNQFTISTCEVSNSTFGRDIDAPFLSSFPVAHERFVRNIESASGNLPSLLFFGKAEINGKIVDIEYEVTADKKKLVTRPIVEKKESDGVIRYAIQAAPADVAKMIRNIDCKAARQGNQILDRSGKPVSGAELLAQAGVHQFVPDIKCEWNYRSWAVAAQREFVKIALGAAHFVLGEPFSRSVDANLLRNFLTAPEESLDKIPISGSIWPMRVENPLSVFSRMLAGASDHHLVAILHMNEQLLVFISLFGEMNGKIMLSSNPAICSMINQDDGAIIQLDPMTRAFQRRTFVDLLKMLAEASEKAATLPTDANSRPS